MSRRSCAGVVVVVVSLAFACAEKREPAPAAGSGEAVPATVDESGTDTTTSGSASVTAAAASADAAATKTAAANDPCEQTCRALGGVPFEIAAEQASSGCKQDWEAMGAASCDHWDRLRNCIYADKGYAFRKATYKSHFGGLSWYKVDPDFTDASLTTIGKKNIRLLKEKAKTCRAGNTTPGTPVKTVKVDLDGDGVAESVEVTTRHVVVGKTSMPHGLEVGSPGELEVVVGDFDSGDKRQEVLLRVFEYEDLANHVLVYHRKGKTRLSDVIYWDRFELDGTGEFRLSAQNCGQKMLKVYKMRAGRLALATDKTTGKHDESMCAACPYVYIHDGADWSFRGEILRHHRGVAADAMGALRLGPREGLVRVRIAERKDERTYLDHVELLAGDIVLEPEECRTGAGAFCARDGRYHVMSRGDELDLSFRVPSRTDVVLRAAGHYIPR